MNNNYIKEDLGKNNIYKDVQINVQVIGVNSLAGLILKDSLIKGRAIEIPSLNLRISNEK